MTTALEESKPWWQSKTLWVNIVMVAAVFFPPIKELLTEEVIVTIMGVVNSILRFFTKKAIG